MIDGVFIVLVGSLVARWGLFLALALVDWRIQRSRGPDPNDVEPLTVVVPAWNEERVIERTVRSLLASDLSDLTVIVVDDGSTDGTADRVDALVAADPRVTLVRQPVNAGKAAALNAGIEAARTAVVATVDADTLVDPACLRWLVATRRQEGADAVAANVRVGNRRAVITRWQSLEYVAGLNLDRRALHRLGLITTVPGACALWRRDAVRAVGGFSSDTLAEDTDLTVTLLATGAPWCSRIAPTPGRRPRRPWVGSCVSADAGSGATSRACASTGSRRGRGRRSGGSPCRTCGSPTSGCTSCRSPCPRGCPSAGTAWRSRRSPPSARWRWRSTSRG